MLTDFHSIWCRNFSCGRLHSGSYKSYDYGKYEWYEYEKSYVYEHVGCDLGVQLNSLVHSIVELNWSLACRSLIFSKGKTLMSWVLILYLHYGPSIGSVGPEVLLLYLSMLGRPWGLVAIWILNQQIRRLSAMSDPCVLLVLRVNRVFHCLAAFLSLHLMLSWGVKALVEA